MSRWKAAAIHLSISAAIGLVAAVLIFGVWYPSPYSYATGALELVVLLMGVDIVLGPLLTLAVFKSGKKGMKFDLSVIALLQAGAFLYGMSVVVKARPVFVVGAVDRFTLVSANGIAANDLAEGKPPYNRLSWTGPRLVGAELPTDKSERNDLLFAGLAGRDLERMPKYYVDYPVAAAGLLKRARELSQLRTAHPSAAKPIDAWLRSHQRHEQDILWLPILSKNDTTMLLDRDTGTPLDALPIDPW